MFAIGLILAIIGICMLAVCKGKPLMAGAGLLLVIVGMSLFGV